MSDITTQLIVRDLGLQPYQPIWQAMQSFTENRDENTVDEIWLLEHESVFTQGQAGDDKHLLASGDIPVIKVDRGGQVTYHGPGQLVAYILIDIKRRNIGVRALVDMLEQSISELLAYYDINAYPKKDAPGVYVEERKICSLGLRIRKGCSFHGLALNVDMDLEPFSRINPCGYENLEMVDCKKLNGPNTVNEAAEKLISQLASKLNVHQISYNKGLFN